MMLTNLTIELKPREFEQIRRFVYDQSGIHLKNGKQQLVKTRLSRRIASLGLKNFQDYLRAVQRDKTGGELTWMLDALTTNKTGFYREKDHFQFLRQRVFPAMASLQQIRIWSAACSTGEEPVSIAIEASEHLPGLASRDFRILATDLSARALEKAKAGIFAADSLKPLAGRLAQRYFRRLDKTEPARYLVDQKIRSKITYARLNLMARWPMKGPFQVIFCRNAMIYFDKVTQQRLVNRFHGLLCPGGFLMIGHSESLTGLSHPYRFIQPAVFQRQG